MKRKLPYILMGFGVAASSIFAGGRVVEATVESGYDLTNLSLRDADHCPDLTLLSTASMAEDYYAHDVEVRDIELLPDKYVELVKYFKTVYGVDIVFPVLNHEGTGENSLMTYQELAMFTMGIEDFFNRLNYPIEGSIEIRVHGYEYGDIQGFYESSYDHPGRHIISIFRYVNIDDLPVDFRFRDISVEVQPSDIPPFVVVHELNHAFIKENPGYLIEYCEELGLEYEFGEGFVDPLNRIGFVWTDFTNYGKRAGELHAFMIGSSLYDEKFRKRLIDLGFEKDYRIK